MKKILCSYGLALVASIALIGMPGCSKKSVQSGGDSQSTQGMAKGGSSESQFQVRCRQLSGHRHAVWWRRASGPRQEPF